MCMACPVSPISPPSDSREIAKPSLAVIPLLPARHRRHASRRQHRPQVHVRRVLQHARRHGRIAAHTLLVNPPRRPQQREVRERVRPAAAAGRRQRGRRGGCFGNCGGGEAGEEAREGGLAEGRAAADDAEVGLGRREHVGARGDELDVAAVDLHVVPEPEPQAGEGDEGDAVFFSSRR